MAVKAYVDQIDAVLDRQAIALHARSYDRHDQILDPEHERDSAGSSAVALDHANVFSAGKLPAVFGAYATGCSAGTDPPTQSIRVLPLWPGSGAKSTSPVGGAILANDFSIFF